MRWLDTGQLSKNGYTVVYSGNCEKHTNGVGIIMTSEIAKSMMGFWPISDRAMLMKLDTKPFKITVIQVYAPTQDHSEEEVEEFYEQINNALKYVKSDEMLIIMGDWNAKVGRENIQGVTGGFGLGEMNERGKRLIEFCKENSLVITNTTFQQNARRLYTWKSPGNIHRNQIDFILIRKRFQNAVINAKTYPGADIHSDHIPVICKLKIKLKVPIKSKLEAKLDMDVLREERGKAQFSIEVNNYYDLLAQDEEEQIPEEKIDTILGLMKRSLVDTAKKIVPIKKRTKQKDWITDEILVKMRERKESKNDIKKYRFLDKEIKKMCDNAKDMWYNQQCEQIEKLRDEHKSKEMHNKVKYITNNRKGKIGHSCITSKKGEILFEEDAIQERWWEYIGELFDDERGEVPNIEQLEGPTILEAEVDKAIKSMKNGKSAGEDGVTTEMLQAMDNLGVKRITQLFNKRHRLHSI